MERFLTSFRLFLHGLKFFNLSKTFRLVTSQLFPVLIVSGAAVGFAFLSKFLAMFVELGVQTTLTVHDKHWVGNWWLGFAIFGAICMFWSIWLLGFPEEFPLTKKLRETELCEAKSETDTVGYFHGVFFCEFSKSVFSSFCKKSQENENITKFELMLSPQSN